MARRRSAAPAGGPVRLEEPQVARSRQDEVPFLWPRVMDAANPAAHRLMEEIRQAPMWRLVRVSVPQWVEICGVALYIPAGRDFRIPLRFYDVLLSSEEGQRRALEGIFEGSGVRAGQSLCLNCKKTIAACRCPALL